MDHKKNSHSRRSKRQNKIAEDNFWDCSVCTYRNTAEAFKCFVCDVRKGTSTRKPRINPQLVAQQVAQQYTQSIPKVKKDNAPGGSSSSTPTTTPTPVATSNTPVSSSAIPVSNVVSSTVTTTTTATPPCTSVVSNTATSTVTTVNTTAATLTTTTNTISAASSKVDVVLPTVNKPEKRYSPSVEGKSSSSTRRLRPKLKNVDRSSAEHKAVTVNNVTVIITEFQPKRHYSSSSDQSGHHPSSGPSAPGFNHSNGGRSGGGAGGGPGSGGVGTFQMEGSPAENGVHQDLSHKHQRLAL